MSGGFFLSKPENIDFWQDMCSGIIVENNVVKGVQTSLGIEILSKTVILTNGTFLNGLIHLGEKQFGGGRAAERASTGITEQLVSFRFSIRKNEQQVHLPEWSCSRSLDYSKMEEQEGDIPASKFSFFINTKALQKQRSCYITYTNKETHEILRTGFDRSPMFNGAIQSTGPRYCPSIEDKINRFSERDRHQILLNLKAGTLLKYM